MKKLILAALLLATSPLFAQFRIVEQGKKSSIATEWLIELTKISGTTVPGAVVDSGNNAFRVHCVVGCSAGGSFSDNAVFTFGTTAISVTGFVVDDTATNSATENSAAAPRMSSSRIAYYALRKSDGTEVSTLTGAPSGSELGLFTRSAVYGSQNQLLQQSATNFNLFAEIRAGATSITSTGSSLNVNCTGGCGGAAAFEDQDAFVAGTTSVANAGFVRDDTTPSTLAEDTAGAARVSSNRNQYFQLRDGAGNERGANVTAANALVVDGSAVTQPVSGTVTVTDGAGALNVIVDSSALPIGASTLAEQQTQTTALQILDDVPIADNSAFTDGTTKLNSAGFIFDEVAGTALTENDVAAGRVDSKRAMVMVIEDPTARGTRVGTGGNGNGLTVTCTNCGGVTTPTTYYITRQFAPVASGDNLHIFNAAASGKILKIRSVKVKAHPTAAVTGGGPFFFELSRTTTVGTTCTSLTANIEAHDTNDAALPAQVTAAHTCTTDPVVDYIFDVCRVTANDETSLNAEAHGIQGRCYEYSSDFGKPITLREGFGMMIKQVALSAVTVGNIYAAIEFTAE